MIDALVERVRAMRQDQGLPPVVEDPAQITRIAGLLTPGKEQDPCK